MAKTEWKQPSDPILPEEILHALGASGYPAEVRLLKVLRDGGMDPVIGFRLANGTTGRSREIDLLANFTRFVSATEGPPIRITLRLVIEVKALEPGAAFVGFPWAQPDAHAMRVSRARFGGRPSFQVMNGFADISDLAIGSKGLATAFDPLNSAAVCVQWATVRRTKPGNEQRVIANHEDEFWDDIDGVVRASHGLMHSVTAYPWAKSVRVMMFELPVLIVATPDLWLLDATKQRSDADALTRTPALIFSRTFEHDEGHLHHRFVDVLSEGAVPAFIEACRAVADALEEGVRGRVDEFVAAGEAQHAVIEHARTEAALDDYVQRKG